MRDVSANIAILTKNDVKNHRFLVHFLDPKMAQNGINFHTLFEHPSWRLLCGLGSQFLMDVSFEIAIFKVPTLQDFDKFWTKKGAKMGPKLSIDFALISH